MKPEKPITVPELAALLTVRGIYALSPAQATDLADRLNLDGFRRSDLDVLFEEAELRGAKNRPLLVKELLENGAWIEVVKASRKPKGHGDLNRPSKDPIASYNATVGVTTDEHEQDQLDGMVLAMLFSRSLQETLAYVIREQWPVPKDIGSLEVMAARALQKYPGDYQRHPTTGARVSRNDVAKLKAAGIEPVQITIEEVVAAQTEAGRAARRRSLRKAPRGDAIPVTFASSETVALRRDIDQ